ncbi:hypothetical protein H5410_008027 [Solanum commersonii]|uniref:Retrotransposon gag domain-containing protein n=1 Tax=Solanum commersonii TaxID=4109 RepID=A0A9J6AEH2_SOLCO|nr:hypothetical protein H5410_008027 [Solanum commersonii]
MTNPTASDPIGPGHIMVPNDSPETSEDRATIQHDEHIARLTQEIEDLRSELTRVRDLTNLSITLQSPLPEPRSTTPNPPRFPSLDSLVPKHFPPQQPPPTNNNLPPTTPANPPNLLPVYTPPQSQPPTYTTYATPHNPPLVNPQNQSPTHTPHVSLPTNTYPLPTTNHVNPSNTPPQIQNTPIVQTYTAQHIQGAHIATPYVQHVPPEMEKDVKAKADDVLAREIRDLKEAMRNLQTTRGNKSLEYEDLCVQPDIDFPVGYKLPKFDTFNGIGDPHTHLRVYCDKLVGVGRNERVRMKLFIRSLSSEALACDMAQDFMDRFKFNTDIIPDRFHLIKLKKKSTETFREYALRWSSQKSLEWEKSWKKGSNEEESKTLQPCMLQAKQFNMPHRLSTILHQLLTMSTTPKQTYKPGAPTYNKPHSYQPLQASPFQNRPYAAPRARPNHEIKTTRNYTKIAEPLAQLFERLKTTVVRHDTEDCYGLKNKIEALIKEEEIQLTGPQPNMNNYPLPKHGNADVNMIIIEENMVLNGSIVPIIKVENDTLSAFDALIMTTHEQMLIEVTAATSYMPLYNNETPTIWGAEPEETLKNWTCSSSLVRRESW